MLSIPSLLFCMPFLFSVHSLFSSFILNVLTCFWSLCVFNYYIFIVILFEIILFSFLVRLVDLRCTFDSWQPSPSATPSSQSLWHVLTDVCWLWWRSAWDKSEKYQLPYYVFHCLICMPRTTSHSVTPVKLHWLWK